MYSTFNVCFMCINNDNCADVDEKVVTLVEYILPEINVTKMDVKLRICSACEETIRLFSKFKGVCVENSLLLEATIKETQNYKNSVASTSTNQQTEDEKNEQNSEETPSGVLVNYDEKTIEVEENKFKKVYCCRICKKTCILKISIIAHMRIHEAKDTICKLCHRDCKNTYALKTHYFIKHSGIRNHRCDICDKTFVRKIDLTKHMNTHTVQKIRVYKRQKLECLICHETFLRKFDLLKHIKSHGRVKKCYICKQPYTHEIHLKDNPKFEHKPRLREQIIDWECNFCKKTIKREEIKEHLKSHKLQCRTCRELFKSKQELEEHLKIHENKKKFQCFTCGKKFFRKSDLQSHIMSTHRGIRDYKCEFCNKSFARQFQLYCHKTALHPDELE